MKKRSLLISVIVLLAFITIWLTGCTLMAEEPVTVNFYDGETVLKTISATALSEVKYTPEKLGFTFEGWFLDVEFEQPFEKMPDGNQLTLYSKWTPITFTVVFRNYQDATISTQTIGYGEAATAPSLGDNEYYTFLRWDKEFSVVTTDMIIKPIFSEKIFTIMFKNDDENLYSKELKFGADLAVHANTVYDLLQDDNALTKDGLSFEGWMDEDDKLVDFSGATMPDKNVTYYAYYLPSAPANVTLTSDKDSYIYGTMGALSTYEATYTDPTNNKILYSCNWLLDGVPIDFSDKKVSLEGNTLTLNTLDAGEHEIAFEIYASLGGKRSKTITVKKPLSVAKGTILENSISAVSTSFVYDATPHILELNCKEGDKVQYRLAGETEWLDEISFVAAGNYSVQYKINRANYYEMESSAVYVTVNKATIIGKPTDCSVFYGDDIPVQWQVDYRGFLGEDIFAQTFSGEPQIICDAPSTYQIAEFNISAEAGTLSSTNYEVVFESGKLNVTPRPLKISIDDMKIYYGDEISAPALSYEGFADGEDSSFLTSQVTVFSDYVIDCAIGTYVLSLDGAASSNYAITYQGATLTVDKKPVSIEVDSFTIDYFENAPLYTAQNVPEGIEIVFSCDYEKGDDANQYDITVQAEDDNYILTFSPATLTVRPVALQIEVNDKSITYGDSAPVYTVSEYSLLGEDSLELFFSCAYDTSIITNRAAGEYDIILSCEHNNYDISITQAKLTVLPKTIDLTIESQTIVYGNTPSSFSSDAEAGMISHYYDTLNLTYQCDYNVQDSLTRAVGEYAITAVGDNANYSINVKNGSLTVTPQKLFVDVRDKRIAYGDEAPLNYNVTYRGIFGDDVINNLQFVCNYEKGFGITSEETGYTVTVSGGENANYDIYYVPGMLFVTPMKVTLTVENKTVTYGEDAPQFTARLNKALCNADEIIPEFTTEYQKGDNANQSFDIIADAQKLAIDYPNYRITVEDGELQVAKRPLTVIADSFTITYGDAKPTYTVRYENLIEGDQIDDVVLSCQYEQGLGVNSYVIQPESGSNSNYSFDNYVNGSVEVNAKVVSLYLDNKTVTYGDSTPLSTFYSYVCNELVGDDQISLAYSCAYAQGGSVGTYDITCEVQEDANYVFNAVKGELSVVKKAVTVTANDKEIVYGDAVPTDLTAVYTLVNDDEIFVSYSTDYQLGSRCGEYAITPSAVDANYDFDFVSGSLTVQTKTVSISVTERLGAFGRAWQKNDWIGIINTVNGDNVAQGTLITNGDEDDFRIEQEIEEQGTALTSFSWATPLKIERNSVDYTDCYNFTYQLSITFEVRQYQFTANSYVGIYDGNEHSANAVAVADANCDGFTVEYSLDGENWQTSITFVNSGEYHISYRITPNEFYDVVEGTLTVTINKKALSARAVDKSITYGDALPTLDISYVGFVENEDQNNLDLTGLDIGCAYQQRSDVGSYVITIDGILSDNYDVSYVNGSLTVNKKTLTITAENYSITYGDNAPNYAIAYNGFIAGEGASDLQALPTITSRYAKFANVGDYVISVSGASSKNYDTVYQNGNLSVSPYQTALVVSNMAIQYGTPLVGLSASIVTLNNDVIDYSLSCEQYLVTSVAGSEYAIVATYTPNDNYVVQTTNGLLTVQKRQVTVTAQSYTITYGDNAPSYVADYQLVNGDTVDVNFACDYDVTDTLNRAAKLDGYQIMPSAADANYEFDFVIGKLTVNKKELQVTANSNTISYGAAIPIYTSQTVGLAYSDVAPAYSYECAYTKGSNVGSYSVAPSFASAQNNYYIKAINGNLIVDKLATVMTINNSFVEYHGTPVYTATFEPSLVVGTTIEYELRSDYATNSSVGTTFEITALNTTSNANYNVQVNVGTLEVIKKNISVVIQDKTIRYGQQKPDSAFYSFSAEGLIGSDTITPQFSTTYAVGSPVGDYEIDATANHVNYTFSWTKGSLSVTPAILTVKLNDVTVSYGDVINYTYTYSGWMNGEDDGVITTAPSASTDYHNRGVFNVVPYGAMAPNYVMNYLPGKLTINPKAVSVSWNVGTYTYSGSNQGADITATYQTLQNVTAYATVSFSGQGTAFINAGSYTATASVASDSPYTLTGNTQAVIMEKAPFTATTYATVFTGTYLPTKTLAGYTLASGYSWADSSLVPNCSNNNNNGYTANYSGDNNHLPGVVRVNFNLAKATVTFQGSTTQGYNYSGSAISFNVSQVTVKFGATNVAASEYTLSTISKTEAGTYGFTPTFTSDNYTGTPKFYLKIKGVTIDGTYYTIEDALTAATNGKTIRVITNTSFATGANNCYGKTNHTLVSGASILIPYSSGDNKGYLSASDYDAHPATNGTETLYLNLTIPSGITLTVRGNLTVGALTGSKEAGTRQNKISGAYSKITLEGNIVANNATVRIMGKVIGDGSITASNSTIIENLYLAGWMGGTISTARYAGNDFKISVFDLGGDSISIDNPCQFPYSQYELRSIESTLVLNHGSILQGYTKISTSAQSMAGVINIDAQINEAYMVFVTNSTSASGGLIRTTSGAVVTKTYNATTQRVGFALQGTCNDGYTALTMCVIGLDASMSTQTVIFPIDGRTDMVIKSGSTFNQNYKYKLMPGATLTVESGATYNANGTLVVYTSEFDDISTYPYPGAQRGDAIVTIFGTLNINGSFGGAIRGGGSGRVVTSSNCTLTVTSKEGDNDGSGRSGLNYVFKYKETDSVTKTATLVNSNNTTVAVAKSRTYNYNGTSWS